VNALQLAEILVVLERYRRYLYSQAGRVGMKEDLETTSRAIVSVRVALAKLEVEIKND
jgi:hypothetical protein